MRYWGYYGMNLKQEIKKKNKQQNPKEMEGENKKANSNEMENKESADSAEGQLFFPEP